MMRRYLRILAEGIGSGILIFFASSRIAFGAFGISPPFMNVGNLVRGSQYIQTIYLVQDRPDQDLPIIAKLDIPASIRSWFKLTPGEQFSIPKGTRQFPFTLEVDIPKDTDLGVYKGNLTFTTGASGGGQVAIALGAQVAINLTVGTDIYRHLTIPVLKPMDIEEGWNPRIYAKINNEGNIAENLDGGIFELSDQFGAARLAYIQKGREFPEIPAFTIKEFTSEFPTDFHLGIGQYWASITLLQDGKAVATQRTVFSVLKRGSLSTPFERVIQGIVANWPWYAGSFAILALAVGGRLFFVRRRRY